MARTRFKILSITGGGYPGLFSSLILQELEERIGKPLCHQFDLISGTSVGGIIALGIACGVSMEATTGIFLSEGETIFPRKKGLPGLRTIAGVMHGLSAPRHDGSALRKVIFRMTGQRKLGELDTEILVPALRVRDGEPVLFTRQSHPETLIGEVALATSAAPTMLPASPVNGVLHADGAVFANCPDELALNHALGKGIEACDISMLSIGVPRHPISFPPGDKADLGILDWMSEHRLLSSALHAQDTLAEHRLGMVLGSRYLRIKPEASHGELSRIGLDLATMDARSAIAEIADRTASRLDWPALQAFVEEGRRVEEPA